MSARRLLATVVVAALLAACAQVTVTPYDPTTYTEGAVFPASAPYLLVSPPGDGKPPTYALEYLPDYAHQYVVRETGLFGSADFKPTFNANGTLAGLDATVDKTSPLSAFVASLGTAAASLHPPVASAKFGAPVPVDLAPGLYRIDLRHGAPRLEGPLAASVVAPLPAAAPLLR